MTRRCLTCATLIHTGSRCPACTAASPYQQPTWRRFTKHAKADACAICNSNRYLTLHHQDGRQPASITTGRFITLCGTCHSRYEGDLRAGRDTRLRRLVQNL